MDVLDSLDPATAAESQLIPGPAGPVHTLCGKPARLVACYGAWLICRCEGICENWVEPQQAIVALSRPAGSPIQRDARCRRRNLRHRQLRRRPATAFAAVWHRPPGDRIRARGVPRRLVGQAVQTPEGLVWELDFDPDDEAAPAERESFASALAFLREELAARRREVQELRALLRRATRAPDEPA